MTDSGTSALSSDTSKGDLVGNPGSADRSQGNNDPYAYDEETDAEPRGRRRELEEFDENDARAMSPRRSVAELERIGNEARAILEEQAKALQSGLLALLERVEKVKEEHEKLEAENRFLQEYIGSLMATSKITGTGPSNNRTSRSGMGRVK